MLYVLVSIGARVPPHILLEFLILNTYADHIFNFKIQ